MPNYRIFRLKEGPRETFRWAAHTGGMAIVKMKDYDLNGEIEAGAPYAAWKALTSSPSPLRPGDLLESPGPDGSAADLKIVKYIGLEPAQWYVPEIKTDTNPTDTNPTDTNPADTRTAAAPSLVAAQP